MVRHVVHVRSARVRVRAHAVCVRRHRVHVRHRVVVGSDVVHVSAERVIMRDVVRMGSDRVVVLDRSPSLLDRVAPELASVLTDDNQPLAALLPSPISEQRIGVSPDRELDYHSDRQLERRLAVVEERAQNGREPLGLCR